MRIALVPIAVGLFLSASLAASAQGYWSDEAIAQRHARQEERLQHYRDVLAAQEFHGLLPQHLADMNYSEGAALSLNQGQASAGMPGSYYMAF